MMSLPSIKIKRGCGQCRPDCPACLAVVVWHWRGLENEVQEEGYRTPSEVKERAMQLIEAGAVVHVRICT